MAGQINKIQLKTVAAPLGQGPPIFALPEKSVQTNDTRRL
jgi:hypothetical protein